MSSIRLTHDSLKIVQSVLFPCMDFAKQSERVSTFLMLHKKEHEWSSPTVRRHSPIPDLELGIAALDGGAHPSPPRETVS